jgi:DNA repair exonuclease SbcCD ATPase subunit
VSVDLHTVSPADLQEARAELDRHEAAWRAVHFAEVNGDLLTQAHAEKDKWQRRLGDWKNEIQRLQNNAQSWRLSIHSLEHKKRTCERLLQPSSSIVMAIAAGTSSVLLAFSCGIAATPALGVLAGFLLFCVSVIAFVFWFYLGIDTVKMKLPYLHEELARARSELSLIDAPLEKAQRTLDTVGAKLNEASILHNKLIYIDSIKRHYWSARERFEAIQQIVESAKWKLFHADWRSMRSIEFEHFLQQVFEALGYTVQTTKASGDQGLDLILIAPGRRIGIQVKGYAKNVGNDAVQEAYTGMAFYKCDACAVITNSDFTTFAIDAAQRVGCTLISGRQMKDLITGNIRF